ncbi:lymphocyte expansion molecule-like isoform X1 [Coccinella septempunctata]|uniref:lymphocyte expansion molecule-like isoform X1 n=2 Tax=Coccinella septempunctata TaxID=41139 RepID=UPI001D079151|nr:lymphocyte expansion molecule-like isoform X1 [Coccinella septempunctata]
MVKRSADQSRNKTITPRGFSSSTPRFARLGLHPSLDTSGTLRKVNSRGGPGQYDIGFVRCPIKKTAECKWTRMVELEEFSKFLGYRNAPILEARAFQRIHRGPGTYNIPDDIDKRKSCSVVENKGFTTERKFCSHFKYNFPPMNTYFRDIFAKHPSSKKPFGKVQRFEWDGLVKRFKDTEPSFKLPPNVYNVPDPKSLEALIKRVVSTKGPYNLFTGKRDGTSIKNHFSPPYTIVPDWYHLEPSDIDVMLHHPMKSRYGKFFQEERFPKKPTSRMQIANLTMCYKDPEEPGPGHYDLSREYSFKPQEEVVHAFGSSNMNQRPPTPWPIHPGPGRYFIKTPSCRKKTKPSWVFLSKLERAFFDKPESYADF